MMSTRELRECSLDTTDLDGVWDYDQDPTGRVIPDDRPEGPRYPDITVKLVGEDGNAFAILGAVSKALRAAGYGDEVQAFHDEATAGDYDELLRTVMDWVSVS